MEDLLAGFVEFGAGAELQDAAGIGGDDDRSGGGFGVLHLFGEELHGGGRFGDVVNSRGAAAVIGEGHFHEFDAGNGANEFARRFADFLAMRKMTGILIRDAELGFVERGGEAEFGEKFGDIADARGKFGGACGGRAISICRNRVPA